MGWICYWVKWHKVLFCRCSIDIYLYAVNIDKEDYHKLTFNSDDNRGTYTFKYVKSGDDYGDFPNIIGVIKWMKGEDEVNDLTGFVGIEDITVVAEWTTPLNVMKKNVINVLKKVWKMDYV